MILALIAFASADPSALYGVHGDAWDRTGRLPDYSYAGYHAGEAPLPDVPVVTQAADFGALPDDGEDDTAAIQAALDATEDGAVELLAGTYTLDGGLRIEHSNVVLRGQGESTVLQFNRSLSEVRGPAAQWSWQGGLIWVEPTANPTALTDISSPAERGATQLTVASTEGIEAGQLVVLSLVDNGDGSLGRHLHNDQFDGGDCDYQVPLTLDWPVFVASVDDATHLTLAQPLRTDARAEWSPALRSHPHLHDVGIEHLSLRFPDVPYAGHLDEPGYNGVFFQRGVVDSWVRDVTMHNADNGVLIDRLAKRNTVSGLTLAGRKGHHGLNIAFAADGLHQDLHFGADFVHHITVDHRANGNVFKRVSGEMQVHLDHHRDSPFENLFTDFTAETSFFHGGNLCAGNPAGARETMWGLPGPLLPPYWGAAQANTVGELTLDDSLTDEREWVENVIDLRPRDLHADQLALRLGEPWEDTAVPEDTSPPEDPPASGGCACDAGSSPRVGWAALLLLGLSRTRTWRRAPGRPRRTPRSSHR